MTIGLPAINQPFPSISGETIGFYYGNHRICSGNDGIFWGNQKIFEETGSGKPGNQWHPPRSPNQCCSGAGAFQPAVLVRQTAWAHWISHGQMHLTNKLTKPANIYGQCEGITLNNSQLELIHDLAWFIRRDSEQQFNIANDLWYWWFINSSTDGESNETMQRFPQRVVTSLGLAQGNRPHGPFCACVRLSAKMDTKLVRSSRKEVGVTCAATGAAGEAYKGKR